MSIIERGLDGRCFSSEKIVPPHPLPLVSRKALKRVKDRVAIPTLCRYCNGPVRIANNAEVYGGREFGEWPFIYLCEVCRAYVGLHPFTDLPLGLMADADLRDARKAAKIPFAALVKHKFKGNRSLAYQWLSFKMSIPVAECHFGMMEEDLANQALEICFTEQLEGDVNLIEFTKELIQNDMLL